MRRRCLLTHDGRVSRAVLERGGAVRAPRDGRGGVVGADEAPLPRDRRRHGAAEGRQLRQGALHLPPRRRTRGEPLLGAELALPRRVLPPRRRPGQDDLPGRGSCRSPGRRH